MDATPGVHYPSDVMATNALESPRTYAVNVDVPRARAVHAISWVGRITPVAAAISFGIGALVLLSWATGTERFSLALPGFIIMIPNAAVAFVGASLSLWLQRQGANPRSAVSRVRLPGLFWPPVCHFRRANPQHRSRH
jgi:hypothetical protein